MIDLNKIIDESLEKIERDKFVEKTVQDRLEKTIKEIIDDTFRSYGDFGKQLKQYINDNLNVDLNHLSLQGYNTLILKALQEKLDEIITIQGVEKMKTASEQLLTNVKKEYTLTELIEELKKEDCSDLEEHDIDDRIALVIDGEKNDYVQIYLDLDDTKDRKYSYDYQISLDPQGKVYSISFEDKEIDSKKILGGLFGFEAILYKIYSSGAKIVLDEGIDADDYDYVTLFRNDD